MADIENLPDHEQHLYILLRYIQKFMKDPNPGPQQIEKIAEHVSDALSLAGMYVNANNKLEIKEIYEVLLTVDNKLDFSRIYGDNRMRIILYYNLGFCYQDRQHADIEIVMKYARECFQEYRTFLTITEGAGNGPETGNLTVSKFMTKLSLQIAAMYGFQGFSEKALSYAVTAFEYLGILLQSMKDFYLSCHTVKDDRHFKLITFFGDIEIFYNHIRNTKNNPTKTALKSNKPLNWEYNFQNKEKQFSQSNSEYDIDLKFYTEELASSITIESVLLLSPITDDLFDESTFENVFGNDDFIIDFILIFSVTLFALSTEKRVSSMQTEEERLRESQSNKIHHITNFGNEYRLGQYFNSALSAKRTISLSQNATFVESEFYLKKCLEALNRYLVRSNIFDSVLAQYYRHYTKVVNYITEEEEPSQTYSALFSDRKEKKSVINDTEESSISNIIINNINITHNTCNIDNGKSFKKRRGKSNMQPGEKAKFDLTPIKTSINDLSGNDNNMAKDLDQILNELKTSPTLEPRTSQESANNFMLEPMPTIVEKDEKAKPKVFFPKKGYLTKNTKALKELIDAQKDDLVVRKLKDMFTRNRQPTIDDIKKALVMKDEPQRPQSNIRAAKHKSQDLKVKVKDIIKNNLYSNHLKKGSFAAPSKILKTEVAPLNFSKCKEVFSKHSKTLANKIASPRMNLDLNARKNSPSQLIRPESCLALLKKYKTVDFGNKRDGAPDSPRNLASPRRNGPTLDIKTIKANLKNSTMKSSRSREKRKLNIHALKSLDDYRSFTMDDGSLSCRGDVKPRVQSPLVKHPRTMSSSKLSPRPNQK